MIRPVLTSVLAAASLTAFAQGPFQVQFNVQHATCGSTTGSISVYAWGATAPYSFLWSNGATTQSITAVPAGAYSVTITDANAADTTVAATIIETPDLFPPPGPGLEAWTCSTNCEGNWYYWVPLQGASPFTTVFDPPGPIGNATPNGLYTNSLCVGSYDITISDANGCTGTIEQLNVVGPMGPFLLDSQVSGSCPGGSTGSFTLTFNMVDSVFVTGPNGTFIGVTSNPFTAGNLPVGTYMVYASIGGTTTPPGGTNGCSASFQVVVPETMDPCGSVSGAIYAELNGDCALNGDDIGIPYRVLSIEPGSHLALTDANGLYGTELFYGSYSLDPTMSGYDVLCPDPVPTAFTLDAANTSETIDAAQVPQDGPDVSAFIAATVHRPGLTSTYTVMVQNTGPWPFTDLTLLLDYDDMLSVVSTTGSPSVPAAGQLAWSIPALSGFGSVQFQAVLMVPAIPSLVGTVVSATATVSGLAPDSDPSNDAHSITRTIVNSYDPNDKLAATSSQLSDAIYFLDIDAHIDYTIRFQNTGTAEAINVYLLDTISPLLNLPSLQILGASHAFTAQLLSDRVLRFAFDGIMLPDSASDPLGSQGFVAFRLKPLDGLAPNTDLENAADIFFDINDPVRTNTSVLTTDYSVGIAEASAAGLTMQPNPCTDILVVEAPAGTTRIDVLSIDGRLVASEPVRDRVTRLAVDRLPQGLYLVRATGIRGVLDQGRFVRR